MAITRFNDPVLVPGNQLEVSGPFDPENDIINGEVTICFLLVQDGATATDPPVIVHNRAIWKPGMTDGWQTVIPAGGIQAGAVRTIGAAIIVRTVQGEPIPMIDVITWCVPRTVREARIAS
jgi:hypothetical protein